MITGMHSIIHTRDPAADRAFFRDVLGSKGIECGAVSDQGWGLLTTIRLPGGGELGIYEPRHAIAHGAVRA